MYRQDKRGRVVAGKTNSPAECLASVAKQYGRVWFTITSSDRQLVAISVVVWEAEWVSEWVCAYSFSVYLTENAPVFSSQDLHWSFTPPVVFNIYLYPLFLNFSFPFYRLQIPCLPLSWSLYNMDGLLQIKSRYLVLFEVLLWLYQSDAVAWGAGFNSQIQVSNGPAIIHEYVCVEKLIL